MADINQNHIENLKEELKLIADLKADGIITDAEKTDLENQTKTKIRSLLPFTQPE